ncbi:MAG: CBS domain-containing protein [Cardiobacteriaceae bacterium]|nr:CBS domain-containing protein [Cardiobacteriaceae bacterium]
MSNSCTSIMLSDPITLKPTLTIKETLEIVRNSPSRYMPVVDENGDYLGVFSSMTLIRLLLPESVSIKGGKNKFELDFMDTSLPELKEKVAQFADKQIKEYIITDEVPTCTPKTSVMEALNLLYKHRYHTIVLEENSRKFLGIVSIKGTFKKILES